jgi:hypothetical protein
MCLRGQIKVLRPQVKISGACATLKTAHVHAKFEIKDFSLKNRLRRVYLLQILC